MFVLLPRTPRNNNSSFNAKTLVLYFQYNCRSDKKPLVYDPNLEDSPIVHDVDCNPVMCLGGWKNINKSKGQLMTTINRIHNNRCTRDNEKYEKYCKKCRQKLYDQKEDRYDFEKDGCASNHRNVPKMFTTCNPVQSNKWQIAKQKYVTDPGYVTKSASYFLLDQIKTLERHCLTSGNKRKTRTYLILIVSVRLFLRYCEFSQLKIESFDTDKFLADENGVRGLNLSFMGKKSRHKVNKKCKMFLFEEESDSVLDPVRLLFTYIRMFGIKDGFLFPSSADLEDETACEYREFSRDLKELVAEVLPGQFDIDSIRTHFLRNTAYYLQNFQNAAPLGTYLK